MDLYQKCFEFTADGLLVVGGDGRILQANLEAESLFGYGRDELVGEPVERLIPERFARDHAAYRERYMADPVKRPMGSDLELFGRRKDGDELPIDVMLSPLPGTEGPTILCVVRDVTSRVEADQRLRESLVEKEVLLQEIHHRVKNNLAVITNLFFLEANSASDEATRRLLLESQSRVQSMALVHETLYRSGRLSAVDLADYVLELGRAVFQTYDRPDPSVRLTTSLDAVEMGVDLAVPTGLILNELMTNALRHGFSAGRGGTVEVSVARRERDCVLTVRDDGVGMRPDFDWRRATTLGLRLVNLLVRQVRAELTISPGEPGTVVRLTIPLGVA